MAANTVSWGAVGTDLVTGCTAPGWRVQPAQPGHPAHPVEEEPKSFTSTSSAWQTIKEPGKVGQQSGWSTNDSLIETTYSSKMFLFVRISIFYQKTSQLEHIQTVPVLSLVTHVFLSIFQLISYS